MANQNKPCGLSPHSYMNGAKWTGQATMYYIASTDPNAFAIGDPVTLVSGGADAGGIPGVTLATAGDSDVLLGPVVGVMGQTYGGPNTQQFGTTIIPATKTTAYYVLVSDDDDVIYEIQEGGAHAALTTSSVGKNFNLLSGTNNGYISGWMFDNNTSSTSSVKQIQLLRLLQRVDNTFGAYAHWLCRINQHQFAAPVAGV